MSFLNTVWKAPSFADLVKEAKEYDPKRSWGTLPPFLIAVPLLEVPLALLWYKNIKLPFHEIAMLGFPAGYYAYEGFKNSSLGALSNAFSGGNIAARAWDDITHPSQVKLRAKDNVAACIQEMKDKKKKITKGKLKWCAAKKQVGQLFGQK
jgi:hypothetical protein